MTSSNGRQVALLGLSAVSVAVVSLLMAVAPESRAHGRAGVTGGVQTGVMPVNDDFRFAPVLAQGGTSDPGCVGDIDGNGVVDTVDFLALLEAWGPCQGCAADLNMNGVVDTQDFLALLAAWGDCP